MTTIAIFYATKKRVLGYSNGTYSLYDRETGYYNSHSIDVMIANKNIIPYDSIKIIKKVKTKKGFLKNCQRYEIDIADFEEDEINNLI